MRLPHLAGTGALVLSLGAAAALHNEPLPAPEPAGAAAATQAPLRTADGTPVGRVAPARQEYPTTPYKARLVFTRFRFDDGGNPMVRSHFSADPSAYYSIADGHLFWDGRP